MYLRDIMLKIPQVTLVAMSGIGHKSEANIMALERSSQNIEFGSVKYIQLGEIKDIDSWNKAIIYELPKYVETSHALLIHADGYVVNSVLWRNEWLQYDWASSPWPLPTDNYSYRSESGKIQRVGNSVGLRSKKLMDLMASIPEKEFWAIKEKYGNANEDGFICCHNREWLESKGIKFMPFEEALNFGKEAPLPENENLMTFLFHKYV